MLWLLFAALTALFESLKDVFSKKSLKHIDEYVIAWSLGVFALPFLLPLLFFIGIPAIGDKFWLALVVGGLLNVVAITLYMKAIKSSDLSITVPMVAFTPLFMLLTSPIILGEFPAALGVAGIFLIVIGSYVLNIKKRRDGYLEPFRALLKEKGSRIMLGVAFIWSITSNIDKVGVQNSSPIFWVIASIVFVVAAMLPVVIYKSKRNMKLVPLNWKLLLPIGLFMALTLIFQMTAINMTLAAYVISIKRTSVILCVFFGWRVFREKGIRERLLGAIIMILGVVLITLS